MQRIIEYVRQFARFQRNARLYLVSNALSGMTTGIFLVLYNLYLTSLGYKADFVGGVSYQSYINDLNNLLVQLHTKTRARLVMANLPDLTLLPAFSQEPPAKKAQMRQAIEQWDQGIAQLASRYGVTLVNLLQDGSEITAHPNLISGDGFHPSAQGYQRLAELFWQAITR